MTSTVAIAQSASGRRWRMVLTALVIALIAMGGFWGMARMATPAGESVIEGKFFTVVPADMDVTISKDGELQSIDNIDILCKVEGQTMIQKIVREGSSVKKGDELAVLDSAQIRQKLEDATLELQRAEADLLTAKEQLEIQESQNAANLEAANVELLLAQLDLQQYTEGTYPQQLNEAQKKLEMARITLKNKEEDLAQTRKLFTRGFVTAADVKRDELAVMTAQNDLANQETALRVLSKYTHEKDQADKKNKLAQAEQKHIRVQRETKSQLAQKMADVRAKEQNLMIRKRRFEKLEEQLASCVITAPADGMVIYGSSGNDRWRYENPIQEGTTVREQQLIMRLPDTSRMKATIRVPETIVPKLRLDGSRQIRATVKIAGFPDPIGATVTNVSVMPDNSQRWWNPDLKEYPVDLTLDETPPNLKPGMGAHAELYLDRLSGVLAVPVTAIYAAGADSYVFAREGEQLKPMKVQLAATNETHAQVSEGIVQGQQLLLLQAGQGRALLEKAGIKVQEKKIDDDVLRQRQQGKPQPPANAGPPAAAAPAKDGESAGAQQTADAKQPGKKGEGRQDKGDRDRTPKAERVEASLPQ